MRILEQALIVRQRHRQRSGNFFLIRRAAQLMAKLIDRLLHGPHRATNGAGRRINVTQSVQHGAANSPGNVIQVMRADPCLCCLKNGAQQTDKAILNQIIKLNTRGQFFKRDWAITLTRGACSVTSRSLSLSISFRRIVLSTTTSYPTRVSIAEKTLRFQRQRQLIQGIFPHPGNCMRQLGRLLDR